MKWRRSTAALLAILVGSGAASAADQLRIDLRTSGGQTVADAECVGANQVGVQQFRSGRPQPIRTSSSEMLVVCSSPQHGHAMGALRANAGFGYPTWVEMVFGEVRMFDAPRYAPAKALKGTPPGQYRPLGVPANPTSLECQQQLPGVICDKEPL